MIPLGDPNHKTADGTTVEIHLVVNGSPLFRIHGDLIKDLKINKGASGTILSCELCGKLGSGLAATFNAAEVLEVWSTQNGSAEVLVARVTIDYFNAEQTEDSEMVHAEGRGPFGALIDKSWSSQVYGSMRDFITRAGEVASLPVNCIDLPEAKLNAFVNTPSIYGVLRALGASMGFILREDKVSAGVEAISCKAALEEARSRTPVTISVKDIQGMTSSRGRPITRRDGGP